MNIDIKMSSQSGMSNQFRKTKWLNPLETIQEDCSLHQPCDETKCDCSSQSVITNNVVEVFYKFRNQKWHHPQDVLGSSYKHEGCEKSKLECSTLPIQKKKSCKICSRLKNVYLQLKKKLCQK